MRHFARISGLLAASAVVAACGGKSSSSPTIHFERVETGVTQDLHGVFAASADSTWLAGDAGTMLRWRGLGFAPVAENATTNSFRGVWGTSDDDLWAVATADDPAQADIAHWDGMQWQTSMTGGIDVHAVWCRPGSTVWAGAGASGMVRWDGSGWVSAQGPAEAIESFWGDANDDVYATAGSAILHYDGANWTPMISVPSATWRGISGAAADSLWAVGDAGAIAHFDGTTWISVPSIVSANLLAVHAFALDDVWAVGAAGTMLHYDGANWISVPSITDQNLNAVGGLSGSNVWAVGNAGIALNGVIPQ